MFSQRVRGFSGFLPQSTGYEFVQRMEPNCMSCDTAQPDPQMLNLLQSCRVKTGFISS